MSPTFAKSVHGKVFKKGRKIALKLLVHPVPLVLDNTNYTPVVYNGTTNIIMVICSTSWGIKGKKFIGERKFV